MDPSKAAERGASGAVGWSRTFGLLNPLRAVWWLFTSVRFAILLLITLCGVSLVGVLLPQKPARVRGDILAEQDWLQIQEGRFGFVADVFDRTDLFDIFHSGWFAVLLGITVASTAAYIISRFPGVWRSITRPRKRVPDRYFETAPDSLTLDSAIAVEDLEGALRRSRYRVDRFEEEGATYLFADRFAWAQLGTLLTHAAIVIFIFSAVVSRIDSFSTGLFLAEGATLPVFAVRNVNQIQVELLDSHAEFAADGQPLDYYSDIVVYRRGEEVKRCRSTVNSPCSYEGYHFYQTAYFGFGAALEVRDLSSGNVIYRETLALVETAPSPQVVVRDADGELLFEDSLVLTDSLTSEDLRYVGTIVELVDGRILTMGLLEGEADLQLVVIEAASGEGVQLVLDEGETGVSGGLEVTYVARQEIPLGAIADLPLPDSARGGEGGAVLQMRNVVYGGDNVSSGTNVSTGVVGTPELTISGLKLQAVTLDPGEVVVIDELQYTFLGQREFSGLNVRRDRSDYLIWLGAALTVVGLMITFWVPRRRLWAKISSDGTQLAGQAPRHAKFSRELRRLAASAGTKRR
ncbi:MAG: cytochrome c biogenesis protein ResB [Chloroflexi bacterium]|nr:cytochrome c biogenesis protein ResB [Chloroflexota bacterium]